MNYGRVEENEAERLAAEATEIHRHSCEVRDVATKYLDALAKAKRERHRNPAEYAAAEVARYLDLCEAKRGAAAAERLRVEAKQEIRERKAK